ncbi:hypothetical protein BD311DRAFT_675671 [Dichomitus squalens]|uniref:Uncharacterized protein n=1 Tax=Dichomitus squalens TaxID=114155 RepID=A0A4Q9MA95_9APHY|nr:hypothetical protein BD311DRAFT_675671 [Dichomitus squalens]
MDNLRSSGDCFKHTPALSDWIHFVMDRIYHHRRLCMNYITYDMLHSQDVINPRSHPNIMVLSHKAEDADNSHPYGYAQMIQVFHVNTYHDNLCTGRTLPMHFDCLLVCWFRLDANTPYGFQAKRRPHVGFVPFNSGSTFSFLDPALIIHSLHICPLFRYGFTDRLLARSSAHDSQNFWEDEDHYNKDYSFYLVNM